MFERFTDRAMRSVELAQQAARGTGHDEVGTDHLLLGLLGEGGGVAFRALDALGVTLEAANEAVCRRHPAEDPAPLGHLPWTSRFKKVAELAIRESLQLGCNYVGTEHLLLGLIRDPDNTPGALVLADCGIAEGDRGFLADVRVKVLELLRGYAESERTAVPAAPAPPGRAGAKAWEPGRAAYEAWQSTRTGISGDQHWDLLCANENAHKAWAAAGRAEVAAYIAANGGDPVDLRSLVREVLAELRDAEGGRS